MPTRPPKHAAPRPGPARPSASARGYGRDWRARRLAFLRAHPLCARCGGPAEHADHKRAKARGGSDEWDNLEALCASCHSVKTVQVDGGFGRDPKESR